MCRYCEELDNVLELLVGVIISRAETEGIWSVSYGGGDPGLLPMRQDVVDEGNLRDQIFSASSFINSADVSPTRKSRVNSPNTLKLALKVLSQDRQNVIPRELGSRQTCEAP